ncbi:hypothetical protein QR685DRAFT_268520 [Neurospora intermedia]|uniref:Secreted protein n=1 Tax=Neurospora intermedia TaxID=5142 RepID=A0ABR3DE29_NEUIN
MRSWSESISGNFCVVLFFFLVLLCSGFSFRLYHEGMVGAVLRRGPRLCFSFFLLILGFISSNGETLHLSDLARCVERYQRVSFLSSLLFMGKVGSVLFSAQSIIISGISSVFFGSGRRFSFASVCLPHPCYEELHWKGLCVSVCYLLGRGRLAPNWLLYPGRVIILRVTLIDRSTQKACV